MIFKLSFDVISLIYFLISSRTFGNKHNGPIPFGKTKTNIIASENLMTASRVIGKATALKLSNEDAKVVLTARRENRLKELKKRIENEGGQAIVVTGDVTKKEDRI